MTADLSLVSLIVAVIGGVFDFGNMISFRRICSPLYRCSALTDARSDTL